MLSGAELMGMASCQLDDVVFTAPLVLPETQARNVQVLFTPEDSAFAFQLVSTSPAGQDADMITHATGQVFNSSAQAIQAVNLSTLQELCQKF